MSYRIRLRPELLDDASESYRWYEEQSVGLGSELLRSFYSAVSKVQQHPMLFRKVYFDFRRIYLRRFPYALYYLVEEDLILFVMLFHCARNPRFLRRELRNRRN